MKLIGPFSQIVTFRGALLQGPIADEQLEIIAQGGVIIEMGHILAVGIFDKLRRQYPQATIEEIHGKQTLVSGFIDCHTHICFAGNRARDYAMRVAGKSYLEIAKAGGGIWDSVTQTREATLPELAALTIDRANRLLHSGVTTIEVKSGYGLNVESELNILRAISKANECTQADLIPTCLAAHMRPRDFNGSETSYLDHIITDLLPVLHQEGLANRVDIFVEDSAFGLESSSNYLRQAKQLGFALTVHADQFNTGGSALAVEYGAVSADHLEASTDKEIMLLAQSNTVAVVLPGASIGLGMGFAPARKLLNAGACVAIASDWNPGSAPMGDLLTQAAVLGVYEKLTLAETAAGLTFRAAKALNLIDRGMLEAGKLADMQAYPTADYRDIFYNQGTLRPIQVWKQGETI
ncbi:imidazolonepropionase [Parapedobacter tibetensis]|uniref:imidazolonepropionase n=1 Tax=Parapedobacter tibetensis TaxID=2972951 RepID=UPI00214D52A4|nr:imidazolonepropionase [Parapedobacter tibetensis]